MNGTFVVGAAANLTFLRWEGAANPWAEAA